MKDRGPTALLRALAVVVLALAWPASGFFPAVSRRRTHHRSHHCGPARAAAKNNPKAGPAETPAAPRNEFPRTLQPDRILKSSKRGSSSSSGSGYAVTIAADDGECQALARRFDLSVIASLSADLVLRPEHNAGGAGAGIAVGVEVEGTCKATVTQRCVRTNEDFAVDLEFPLYCIVRPAVPVSSRPGQQSSPQTFDQPGEEVEALRRSQGSGGGGANKKKTYRPQDRNIDEMDVMELQRMLQSDISDEDDVLMEDEAIYCTDGLMDVGELVSQLFWLKLDPYPKKPGTNPVQRSISG